MSLFCPATLACRWVIIEDEGPVRAVHIAGQKTGPGVHEAVPGTRGLLLDIGSHIAADDP